MNGDQWPTGTFGMSEEQSPALLRMLRDVNVIDKAAANIYIEQRNLQEASRSYLGLDYIASLFDRLLGLAWHNYIIETVPPVNFIQQVKEEVASMLDELDDDQWQASILSIRLEDDVLDDQTGWEIMLSVPLLIDNDDVSRFLSKFKDKIHALTRTVKEEND